MFSKKPTAILYILRNELIVYDRTGKAYRSALPNDTVDFLEIIDRSRYGDALASLVTASGIRGKHILIVLSDDVTFEKQAHIDKGASFDSIVDEFVGKLPFDPQKQQIVVYQKHESVRLWGTNRDLFLIASRRIDLAGCKVLACVPAGFFDIRGNQALTAEHRAIFFGALKLGKCPDFLANN